MRKILKKAIAAVATAAVCCAMITPMTANAAVCTHKNMLLGAVESVVGGYSHNFMAQNENGVPVPMACSVTVKRYTEAYVCDCGYYELLTGGDIWTEEVHSEKSNPYHN